MKGSDLKKTKAGGHFGRPPTAVPAPSSISEEDGTSQGGACADVEAVAAVIEQPSSGDALCFTCQRPIYKVRHSVTVGVLPVRSTAKRRKRWHVPCRGMSR